MLEALTEGGLIALLVVGLVAGTTFAGAKSSSVWIDGFSAARTASLPYGSSFAVGYASQERKPWAEAVCYVNDSTVLSGAPRDDGSIWSEWFSVYPGGPSPQHFVLGASVSPIWSGGGADCVVKLVKLSGKYNGALGFSNVTVLAKTSFQATP